MPFVMVLEGQGFSQRRPCTLSQPTCHTIDVHVNDDSPTDPGRSDMDQNLALADLGHRLLDHVDLMLRVIRAREIGILVLNLLVVVLEQLKVRVLDHLLRVIVGFVVRQGVCGGGSDRHIDDGCWENVQRWARLLGTLCI